MSKAHMPHWRYIALRMEGEAAPRRALQQAVTAAARAAGVPDDRLPELTRFEWPHAIVRVRHMDLSLARAWLPRIRALGPTPVAIETLSSSGTIKTLTERLGILRNR